jgi:hypothetical protein
MAMIDCRHCGQKTPNLPFCTRCQKPLAADQGGLDGVLDAWGLLQNALTTDALMRDRVIARIQVLKIPDEEFLPDTRPIQVDREMAVFVTSSAQPVPIQLHEGLHSIGDLLAEQGLGTSIQSADAASWCCLCYVRTQPISVVVSLPDLEMLKEGGADLPVDMALRKQCIDRAMRNLGLRDSNNRLGGVKLQVVLQCTQPTNLMGSMVQEYIDAMDIEKGTANLPAASDRIKPRPKLIRGAVPEPESLLARIGRWLAGRPKPRRDVEVRGRPSELIHARPFTLAHIYRNIRMEFQMSVTKAFSSLQRQDLYENQDTTRSQVEDEIRRAMATTLASYGLKLERVSAFEFICPEYALARERDHQLRVAQENVANLQAASVVNKATAEIAQQQEIEDAVRQRDQTLARLDNQAAVAARQDQHAVTAQETAHAMDAARRKHTRDQQRSDTEQDIQLAATRKKSEQDLELERKQRENQLAVELARQVAAIQDERENAAAAALLKFVTEIKGLPPETIRMLVVARSPELAALWATTQQAGAERVIDVLKQQQDGLKAAHAQSSQEITAFMGKVAELIGHVVGENRPTAPPAVRQVSPGSLSRVADAAPEATS